MDNFRLGRRRAIGWLVCVAGLVLVSWWQMGVSARLYTARIPSQGGVYTAGVAGSLDNINPILATSPAEHSAARLLFAQLLAYDDKADLVGELAQSWTSDAAGKIYTVTLKPDAVWQDGLPVTADDVVFTFSMIKNADTRSPLYSSWRNIAVEKINATTIRFSLPSPYAAFLNSLAVGILPQHALKDTTASELRTANFNRAPSVASGPFVFQDLRTIDPAGSHMLLQLTANSRYVLGPPELKGFHLNAYLDDEDLVKAFKTQEIASFGNVTTSEIKSLKGLQYVETDSPLYNGTFAFLNNESPALKDVRVRQALQFATNQPALLRLLGSRALAMNGPLLPGQFGYRADIGQPNKDDTAASRLLDAAGWAMGPGGKRTKDGQTLHLHLVSVNTGDFPAIAAQLMNDWGHLGITFDSQLIEPGDVQQNAIVPRAYDVLLYEIAIGRDPDVYVYWHSSQANPQGLNLSNYRSAKVDEELTSARSRTDPTLRDAKYRAFFQQWLIDAPAIALFRPTYSYVQNQGVVTFAPHPMVDAVDRYFNIRYWAAGRVDGNPTR